MSSCREFAMFSASSAVLVGAYALELTQDKIEVFKIILRLEWLSASFIAVFWLLFSLVWCGYGHLATRTFRAAIMIIPTIDIALAQTNDYHNLVYKAIWVNRSGAFPIFDTINGPFAWVDITYSTICTSVATIIFIQQYRKARLLHRRQSLIMMVASLIPMLLNVGYYLGIGNGIYITAFGLSITAILFAWGIFRHQILDLTPVARYGLVEMMQDPVLVFDTAGRVVDHNQAACRFIHDEGKHGIETNRADISHRTPELALALDRATLEGNNTFHYKEQFFSLSLTTTHPTPETSLILCLLHDITAEHNAIKIAREMTVELCDEREKLKCALERQIRFVDMVSHEYRTPLAIIKANLDILRDRNTDEAARNESISYMQRAITRLVEVVEVSFGMSRLGVTNDGSVRCERIELADFLAEVADEATALWRKTRLNLPPETAILNFVLADRFQLKTALYNLIDNAVKYGGEEQQIDITLEIDTSEIRLSIADQGPALNNAELEGLQYKFRRGSNAVDKEGAGIGLYLVESIVTQYGGRLQLKPNIPHGIIATIILPSCP